MTRHGAFAVGRIALGLAVVAVTYAAMVFSIAPRDSAPVFTSKTASGNDAAAEPAAPARGLDAEQVAGAVSAGPDVPDVEPDVPQPMTIVMPGLTAKVERVDPKPPGPSEAFLQFGTRLQSAVDSYGVAGTYAVAVTDLQTGHTVGANIDRSMLSGCVMNFFVILQAVIDVQEGRYSLDRVDTLIRATIWSSNATTARELYRIVGDGDTVAGVQRVADLHDRLGLDEIVVDHPPAYIGDSLGIDANNWLTAASVNRALAMLWNGDVLDPGHRSYLLEAMTGVKPGLNYLVAAVPGEATVSHKNGFFPSSIGYIDNDAGIVHVEWGGVEYAYAVTFLSQGVPYKYGDIPLGQELMRIAWDYFAGAYGIAV